MKPGAHIICLVSNDLNHDRRMQRICASLVEAGYHVTLVGRKKRKSLPLVKRTFDQKRLWCGFEQGKLFYLILNIRLLWFLLINRFDAICAVDLDTIIPSIWVGKLKGKKIVYDAHEWFSEVPEVINRTMIQGFWRRVEKWAIPRVDARYTVGQSLADALKKRYDHPFEVIRNVPVVSENVQAPDKPTYLLYQGALNDGRGIESMLLVMYNLDLPLYLAGEGDLLQYLRNRVHQMNLSDKVKFLGMLRPGELNKITQQAYIGINLLENKGLSYYHSLSNKFFDYVMAGVPQVCIRFPEYKKLNKEYEVAILIDDLKTTTLTDAITRLLKDQSLYGRLRNNCMRARAHWNWEAEKAILTKIYHEL